MLHPIVVELLSDQFLRQHPVQTCLFLLESSSQDRSFLTSQDLVLLCLLLFVVLVSSPDTVLDVDEKVDSDRAQVHSYVQERQGHC